MSMISLALMAVAAVASYDCTLQTPRALSESDGKVELSPIQFPGVAEGKWKFTLDIENNKGLNFEVKWPENPIQIAGKFAGLPTSDGSFAFAAFSTGPCMFTETMCMTLVQLVPQSDGTAKIMILPAALNSDRETKTRAPFVVVIEGKCTPTGKPK
jgi:hypothetical protein